MILVRLRQKPAADLSRDSATLSPEMRHENTH